MTRLTIATLLALTAGVVLAASPAAAWTCTAKNARGTPFSVVGLFKTSTEARALARCQVLSATTPGSCVVVDCNQP